MRAIAIAISLMIAAVAHAADPAERLARPSLEGSVWRVAGSCWAGRSDPDPVGSMYVLAKDAIYIVRSADSETKHTPFTGKLKVLDWQFRNGLQEVDVYYAPARIFGKVDLSISEGLLNVGFNTRKELAACSRPGVDPEKCLRWAQCSRADAPAVIELLERLKSDGRNIPDAAEIVATLESAE